MQMPADTHAAEPSRGEVESTRGWLLLEFGASWCGHCQAARPLVHAFLQQNAVTHLWVEDGKGRPLGRSFAVKLWPTLVLLRDGSEVARVVRPQGEDDLLALSQALTV
ncbi:thioredoxin family protein [Stenotrophomonas tumulicola]|uniref:Thioredoxin family protein n=1 Tax=Stenotrophomonas tumulicola TaxID=1685415 RepID=A0A7W3IH65_9GAMM|nr:thioredoxin family protein [Stenotrophomonas tumulicola]MBA8680871.1 thioredoxin family protein [Stenotrophomonas tumulicola]